MEQIYMCISMDLRYRCHRNLWLRRAYQVHDPLWYLRPSPATRISNIEMVSALDHEGRPSYRPTLSESDFGLICICLARS
jgi:hypothetical protein